MGGKPASHGLSVNYHLSSHANCKSARVQQICPRMRKNLDRFAARARSPRSWRIRTRRLFLLMLPLSLPLWLTLLAALGVVFTMRAIITPIMVFWNAPPKRARYNYYGGYPSRGNASADNVVPLPARQSPEPDHLHQAELG